ncbi:MAG TPA: glycosyltransferase, partial [Candidatus Polarisedimenticolia bacterium]|nr:glycosyltransferase [Candidatus Polarisedimenticolia bacterium]
MTAPDVGICHVITLLELGGAQENTLYTVSHLRPPFRASLVCGEGGILDDEARAMAEVPTIFVRSLVRPIRPTRDLDALARLTGIFRRMRPRIVHTHSSKAGILGRIAARLAGVPVIVHSIHGYGFNVRQPAPVRAAIIALEKAVAPLTTHFIAVSRANLDQGVELGIFPRRKATLIRSGIPIRTFEAAAGGRSVRGADGLRRELGIPEGRPLV